MRCGEISVESFRRRARLGGDRRESRHTVTCYIARPSFNDVAGHAPAFGESAPDLSTLRRRYEWQKPQRHRRYRRCSSHLLHRVSKVNKRGSMGPERLFAESGQGPVKAGEARRHLGTADPLSTK